MRRIDARETRKEPEGCRPGLCCSTAVRGPVGLAALARAWQWRGRGARGSAAAGAGRAWHRHRRVASEAPRACALRQRPWAGSASTWVALDRGQGSTSAWGHWTRTSARPSAAPADPTGVGAHRSVHAGVQETFLSGFVFYACSSTSRPGLRRHLGTAPARGIDALHHHLVRPTRPTATPRRGI